LFAVEACPGCGMRLATLKARHPTDRGVELVSRFVFQGRTDRRVVITGSSEAGPSRRED
jgi:hypothetical protein